IEEAAMALTGGGLRAVRNGGDGIAVVDDAPPGIDRLPEIARWVTPNVLAKRFDARFFGIEAPSGIEARPDGLEIDRAWWASPSAVLEEYALWETLMWPTFNTLQELATCSTVDDVLALR